jgi:histone arginine demethylase JMJD6
MDQVTANEPGFRGILAEQGTCIGGVDRRSHLSEEEFREEYLKPKKAVILTDEVSKWNASGKWTWDYFKENYGDIKAPTGITFEPQDAMSIAEYSEFVDRYEEERLATPTDEIPRYLEGWYFRETNPELLNDFHNPACFGEDWFATKFPRKFNPIATAIIFGPTGSYTKLHYDGQSSHNWLAQITGRKRWMLIDEEELSSVFKNKSESAGTYEGMDHPGLAAHLENHEVKYRDCITNPGELLFFPSRVYHQVVGLEPTISLTHNWFNGTNARRVYWESMMLHVRAMLGRSKSKRA